MVTRVKLLSSVALFLLWLLAACSQEGAIEDVPTATLPVTPSATATTAPATDTPVITPSATPLPEGLPLSSEDWKSWPVVPVVTQPARQIYLRGQELGNNPHAFSVLGDCHSVPDVFMGVYDTDPAVVAALPPELQEAAAYFSGSFSREAPTAKTGVTAGALLWTQWHEGKFGCQDSETPVACELRLQRPSFVIINIGTHWEARNMDYMRRIIETLIQQGVVPILATKADNREGDDRLNYETALLAVEYGLPVWNFWAATVDLPNHGLYTKKGDEHLGDIYLNDEALQIHRFTALQALDAVWRAVTAGE